MRAVIAKSHSLSESRSPALASSMILVATASVIESSVEIWSAARAHSKAIPITRTDSGSNSRVFN